MAIFIFPFFASCSVLFLFLRTKCQFDWIQLECHLQAGRDTLT